LKWEIISDVKKLALLSEEWCGLNNAVPDSTLFNSPNWLFSWIDQYWQTEWQLFLIIARSKGELIALAPFYLQRPTKWHQPTKLYPLGQGEMEIAEIASEYNDVLITPGYEEQVITELSAKIKTLKADQIFWRAAMHNSHIHKIIQNAYNYQTKVNNTRYLIDCSSWSLEKLSKNTRSRYKRSLNQLKRIDAKFIWVEPQNYQKALASLIEYHQKRWHDKEQTGAFSTEEFQAFHQKMIMADDSSHIKMSAILIGEQIMAINYYLVDDLTLYFYQSGWDQQKFSSYSPGLSLHLWSIEHCEQQYYDFMMGSFKDSYKQKFGCQQQSMINIALNLNKIKVILDRIINKFF